jgi:CRP-like cAMP-binding protein
MKKAGSTYCQSCKTRLQNVFSELTLPELDNVSVKKSCHLYKKGEIIYNQGNFLHGFYCIEKGIVKIYKIGPKGRKQIIKLAKKGDIFGYRSILAKENACTTAEVMEDAIVCQIPSDILFDLIYSNPKFSIKMMKLACEELGKANTYIANLAQKSIRERTAELILNLKKDFGIDEHGFISITLTREDMSEIVGTATESFIRSLTELKNEGLIYTIGKKIKIIDEPKLIHIAKGLE